MELSDFANKKFAIYGLGFRGDNIKVIQAFAQDVCFGVKGHNLKGSKRWGEFNVYEVNDIRYKDGLPIGDKQEVVFDYNLPDNHWHKKYLPNIRKLVDKNFMVVGIPEIPLRIRQLLINSCRTKKKRVIEGTAYWWKFRVGKFWMVEIVSTAVDITYESKPKWIEVRKEAKWAKKWL